MNLTQEQEAALYVQYTPLIYKTVHHFCRLRGIRSEYFEDLFQEASVAFIASCMAARSSFDPSSGRAGFHRIRPSTKAMT